ncbi:glycoside hydrolase family 15 protein [Cellvibrio polysaccharolyticus]|uniref:Phosphorylase kinase n=1 Tax=Cellvibrio polysaccharolyticus TaxID=2082724 RepID=A0A928YU24_9GAMM|nr:glycoside hydrolase family 15 protein [Cellvibrio polysaccharolyticus]MBE8717492.1 phosphorylase kinase [Cellvibrio polysaccharolyticus]
MKDQNLLGRLYREIQSVILSRQHPVTGLLPASTANNNHGNYNDAWVRDNVYSVMAIWTLGQAYRRRNETHRRDELEQATIKLMRGLLQAMMRQAHKVEAFKYTLRPEDALHAKYDTATGLTVVADDAWGHLQIDATSLFLLMLAQMSASGLRIVCTVSEANFVQNLVYYISSAYRTPDYGIWERGNKINNGEPEINASSVGMAKAALQALDGFNVFGPRGDKRGIIQVIPDSISLARNALASLLPRESISKEADSALLSIIGFPAFAVGQNTLVTSTRDNILAKLGGHYGCKRFLWDGHQTALEEPSRIYYEHSELANFEHIESEWPLFFTYLYLGALFDGNESTAKHYREKLEGLMIREGDVALLPELYFVPEENIAAEKQSPGTQQRLANDNLPLVWAQSLYYTGLMLDEGLVSIDDLDPCALRARSTQFNKTQLALVVLADSEETKQTLVKHGVIVESLQDIKPMTVISAAGLMEAYAHVGENEAMGMTGRPRRRLQSLTTSQTYLINNRVYLCLSSLQSEQEDYRNSDAKLLVELITQEITYIHRHWLDQEVAVFTLLFDEHLSGIPNVESLLSTVKDLQLRTNYEYVGYASANLAYRASLVNNLILPHFDADTYRVKARKNTDKNLPHHWQHLQPAAQKILDKLESESEIITYRNLNAFIQKKSLDDNIGSEESPVLLRDFVKDIYRQAQKHNAWLVARLCFSALGLIHTDLNESLTIMSSRNMSVVVGASDLSEIAFCHSFSNQGFFDELDHQFVDPLERTLVLELLSAIGTLVKTAPTLFEGLRSIQLRNFMMLYAMDKGDADDVSMLEWIGLQSPALLVKKLKTIMASHSHSFSRGIHHDAPYFPYHESDVFGARMATAVDTDWFEWRLARGLITHFDDSFLKNIWHSLMFAKQLVFGERGNDKHTLDCELVRSSMTPEETSFAYLMDNLTQQLHPVYYKAAVVEALFAYTSFCLNNPQVRFKEPVIFSEILEAAASRFVSERPRTSAMPGRDLDKLLRQSPHILNLYVTLIYGELTQPY